MKKIITPLSISIACIPLGIIVALVGIYTKINALPFVGNVLTYGGLLALVVILVRRRKAMNDKPQTIDQQVKLPAGCDESSLVRKKKAFNRNGWILLVIFLVVAMISGKRPGGFGILGDVFGTGCLLNLV